MAESTITGDDWVFNLDDDEPKKPELGTRQDALPWLTEPKVWAQYQNPDVYELDNLIRNWIETCSKNAVWAKSYKKRRYTMGMVCEQIYGRKWDPKIDAKHSHIFAKILAYYSSKIQKEAYISGKKTTSTIYTIAPSRLKKPPYSLRLRLEWLAEKGEVPTAWNMKLPEDDLKKGHARNPKTDRNMERRREEARAKYYARYNGHNADKGRRQVDGRIPDERMHNEDDGAGGA